MVSMEGIVDSINTRFKCPWDEDSYRLIVALLNDGISVFTFIYCANFQYMGRLVPLPPTAKVNIKRFSDSRLPPSIKVILWLCETNCRVPLKPTLSRQMVN